MSACPLRLRHLFLEDLSKRLPDGRFEVFHDGLQGLAAQQEKLSEAPPRSGCLCDGFSQELSVWIILRVTARCIMSCDSKPAGNGVSTDYNLSGIRRIETHLPQPRERSRVQRFTRTSVCKSQLSCSKIAMCNLPSMANGDRDHQT